MCANMFYLLQNINIKQSIQLFSSNSTQLGHTRQGLRCRNCKSNVHVDCAAQLTKCQAKQKLLRRQKSTSELVTNRVEIDDSKLTNEMKFNSIQTYKK